MRAATVFYGSESAMNKPGDELQAARPYLLRYATFQLRDPALAEDAVQETLLAALDAPSEFSGRSAFRTWLVGILRHKIIDTIRRNSREQALIVEDEESDSGMVDEMFEPDGHWRDLPSAWGNPEKSFENKKFWEVFERCLETMPARTARAFMMREVMELSCEEICKDLAITPTNLWVLLHRARLSLRGCLEARWFEKAAG
jgi:RNA polymerase sigma-70 factor (ECF subfamily)